MVRPMKMDELSPTDPLFELEHRIAQRADQLARKSKNGRNRALDCWLQAEREIWSKLEPLATPVGTGARSA